MTSLQLELLQLAWPTVWTCLLAGAGWWQRQQMAQIAAIKATLDKFRADDDEFKKEIAQDRADARHRLDKLIGATNARFTAIESCCAIYHGVKTRRSTDPENWAQTSDLGQSRMP